MALSQFAADLHPLKFLVTSRPDEQVSKRFHLPNTLHQNVHSFPLNDIPKEITQRDVDSYINEQLSEIRKTYGQKENWPGPEKQGQLATLTCGVFVLISTALKFIADEKVNNPRGQLDLVLKMLRTEQDSPSARLDGLYTGVTDAAIPSKHKKSMLKELKLVVGFVVLSRDRLSPKSLDALLGIKAGASKRALRLLSSVIALPESDEDAIRIIHSSFADFLVDPSRCTRTEFLVIPKEQHALLAKQCLRTMLGVLSRNICRIPLDKISYTNSEISELPTLTRSHLLPHVRYALCHWAHHLSNAEVDQEALVLVNEFCEKHLLHWLEALSLISEMRAGIDILKMARRTLLVRVYAFIVTPLDSFFLARK